MQQATMRIVPALVALAFSSAASAGAFQLWEQNASGLGVAFAGSAAVADNASTNYFNPAGLTQLSGVQVSVGVAGVGPRYEFHDEGSHGTGLLAGLSGGNGGNAGGWSAVPNAHIAWNIAPNLALGFSVSAPFGLSTHYEDNNWIGRFQTIKSEIKTVNYNPSLAYKLNDKIAVGFGLNYQTIDGELSSVVNPLTNGMATLKGDDGSWGWNVGALFTLSPAMRVGLAYRSAIKHTLEGNLATPNGTLPVKADFKLPDTFTLSVWQQVSDRWEAMGDLSYTRWESLQNLTVISRASGALVSQPEVFNYGNSWRLAWGAAYKYNDAMKAKFGIAYDRTPVQDADRSPRVPDNNRLWLTLGGQWNMGKSGKLDFGYAYLYVKDPKVDQTKVVTTTPVLTTATLQGRYEASAHIVGLQYSIGF